jgi:hypothetical protein
MKLAYLLNMGLVLLGASLINAQDNIPDLAKALKPILTEQEFNYIYEVDDLDIQADRMQELLESTQDSSEQAALQTAINQTIQLATALEMLTGEER